MAEVLHGNASANQLNATTDKTQVYGLAGNDTLTSDGKSGVLLVGGSGSDSLIMSGGNGTLSGGTGADTFELNYSATQTISAVIEDVEPASDKIVVNFDGTATPTLNSVASGNDVVLSDSTGNLNVTLKGVRENDYFDGTASDEVWEVLKLTNDEREAQGLSQLTASEGLTAGAQIRVKEITTLGQTGALNDHTRPNGSQWYTVLDGKYNYPGENLDGGAATPQEVVYDWMNSTSHRENILNANFKKLGVGYNYDDPDPLNHRWYWTQLFADSLNNPETVNTADLLIAKIKVNAVPKDITLTHNPDTYNNSDYGATIAALGGDDSISNTNLFVSVSGGADNDTLKNSGSYVTINSGTGDDQISLSADAKENLIQYTAGNGSDTVSGFNADDIVSISGDEYTPEIIGNDIVVTVGTDSITLKDAAKAAVQIYGTRSKFIILTEDNDKYRNAVEGATITALGGNDSIRNEYSAHYSLGSYDYDANVSINGGDGDDTVETEGSNVTIESGDGNDYVYSYSNNSSIYGGKDSDSISNVGKKNLINAGADNDTVNNYTTEYWDETAQKWTIKESPDNSTILGGAGKDSIHNEGMKVSISGGDGNDSTSNGEVYGDNGQRGNGSTLNGDAGNDYIWNRGSTVTIEGGADNDSISLSDDAEKNLIQYNPGDGRDTVDGFGEMDTLRIGDGTDTYSTTVENGSNIVVKVGRGSVLLRGVASLEAVNIDGVKSVPSEDDIFIVLNDESDTCNNSLEGSVILSYGDNSIANTGNNVAIYTYTGNNKINTEGNNVTVYSDAGNDEINTKGNNVILIADAGDDTINIDGNNVSITGGLGDDRINLSSDSQDNLIYYTEGDGNDIISGLNSTDKLNISANRANSATVGNDVVIKIGDDSVTLLDAATLPSNTRVVTLRNIGDDKRITLTEDNDDYTNNEYGVTIAALGGNDTISNQYEHYSLGSYNHDAYVSINGGAGDDSIRNWSSHVTIEAGDGDDFIDNDHGKDVTITGGAGKDTIDNHGGQTSIIGGTGDDSVYNWSSQVTINGDADKDTVCNYGENVTINGGSGNDLIYNGHYSLGSDILSGGDGDDTIINDSKGLVTIDGGAGDDEISLSGDSQNNFIQYNIGDGNETIWGLSDTDKLQIGNGTGTYSTVGTPSGDDIIVKVSNGSITLKNFRDKPEHIILGSSGTSGGTSSSGDGNSASGNGSSGGTGGSSGNGNGFGGNVGSLGNKSAIGSHGRSSRGSAVSSSSNVGRIRVSRPIIDTTNETGNTNLNFMTTSTQQTVATDNRIIYTGGDQVVPNYTADRKIFFLTEYVGSFYDGAGNYFAGSTTGALVLQNATDKVIDLNDAAGNVFVKAYAATNAGVIDGRGLAGFEIINGSAGSDAIFAGDGGSQLWGGLDVAADVLVGGGGTDIFIGGRTQGADVIANASSTDIVHLNDATLSDIVATAENNGAIAVAFNTGNVVGVQSSEALSATFMLADGSAYRYNHANKSWQSA